jgi:dynein heavy chain
LVAHAGQLDAQLNSLLYQIRGSLPLLRRATLEVLVISLVHARDVVASLVRQNVGDEMDYEWTSRLRYYWEEDTLKVL